MAKNTAQSSNARSVREALTGSADSKTKIAPSTDGILTVTPDNPEILDWRAWSALDVAETSSTYLDDDEDDGPKPHELYGKFTWKIGNFSDISKRELRSTTFDVGGYKWYILIYPQGCDVCNHLSLFLCVADYDKLLPGWSHFAQFTIAVVNKDPKKSKYSDTLHRFCKKEHDWGWKKFMELSKVLDGFTVADTLVIKAQVQVILDKPGKPFRCLDPQYRRELVRVYLTNVEGVCRRFCDEKRARLVWAKDEALKFRDVWRQLGAEDQHRLLSEKADAILKGVVKQFFNEKEVTSTLVMDALYSGCKQIDEHSRMYLEGSTEEEPPVVLVRAERNVFMLNGDIMEIAERATKDFIPMAKDNSKMMQPNDGLSLRTGQDDDYRRDNIERDEKRLAELGRKTVEMFVISQVFTERLEVAYREAEALKRQDQLIAEELAMQQQEDIKRREQAERDKEKRSKKKERMKLKKEAEKARKDADEAERHAQEVAAKRKEQERRAADKKRQAESSSLPSQQEQANKQRGGPTAARQAIDQAPSPSSTHHQPLLTTGKGKQLQQQGQQPSSSVQHTKPSDGGATTNHRLHGYVSSSAAAAAAATSSSPAFSSQQPPLSRPLHMPPSSLVQHLRGDSSTSSSQDRVDLEGSEEGDSNRGVGTLKQAHGQETESLSDKSEEIELDILRTQVHQLRLLLAERDAEIFALHAQLSELQPLAASASTMKPTLAAVGGASTSCPPPEGSSLPGTASSSGGVPFASVEAVETAPAVRGPSSNGAQPVGGSQKPGRGQQHKGGMTNGPLPRQQQQGGASSLPHVASKEGDALTRTGSTSSLASSVTSEVVVPLSSSSAKAGTAQAMANGFVHHHHHHHHAHHRHATHDAPASTSSMSAATRKAAATTSGTVATEPGLPSGVPGAAFDALSSSNSSLGSSAPHTLASHLQHAPHSRANGPSAAPLSSAQLPHHSHRGAGLHQHQPPTSNATRMQRGDTTNAAVLAGKAMVVPPPPPPPPPSRPSPATAASSTVATSSGMAPAPPTAAQALFPAASNSSSGRVRTPSTLGHPVAGGSPFDTPSSSSTTSANNATAKPSAAVPLHPLLVPPEVGTGATAIPVSEPPPPPPAAPSYRNAAAGVIVGGGPAAATSSAAAASVAAAPKQQHAATVPQPSSTTTTPVAAVPASVASMTAAAVTSAPIIASKQLSAGASEFQGQRLMTLSSQADTASAARTAAAQAGPSTMPATAAAVAAAAACAVSEEQQQQQQQGGGATPGQQPRLASQLPADSPGLDDFAHMGLIDDLLGAE